MNINNLSEKEKEKMTTLSKLPLELKIVCKYISIEMECKRNDGVVKNSRNVKYLYFRKYKLMSLQGTVSNLCTGVL